MCERWRQSLLDHYGGRPREDQYVPQCDAAGSFSPLQCHGNSGFCWCVDEHGREIHGTRSEPGTAPPCKSAAGCWGRAGCAARGWKGLTWAIEPCAGGALWLDPDAAFECTFSCRRGTRFRARMPLAWHPAGP